MKDTYFCDNTRPIPLLLFDPISIIRTVESREKGLNFRNNIPIQIKFLPSHPLFHNEEQVVSPMGLNLGS